MLGLAVFLAASGCNATTAHLDDIKTGADKAVNTPSSTFGPKDTIYAVTSVDNNPDKVTLQWHVIAEKATGISPNFKITTADVSEDIDGDHTSTYTLTPPPNGWPTGTFKIEADMIVNGDQKDQKTAEFTVQ
jgi:hypothetical protein